MEESLIQFNQGDKYFTLKSYYIFKFKIEQVWKIISHPAKLLLSLGEWVDKLKYTEDNQIKELIFEEEMKFKKNSILSFRWKSIFQCKHDIKEIIETDFYKKIIFDSYAIYPFFIKYQIIYNLYWDSVEENTLLIHEVVCEENNKLFQNDQEQNIKERYVMFKKIEELLKNDLSALYQEEAIILDININQLWNIVTDWRLLKEYVPDICSEILYQGDPQELGTEMKIINKEKNKNGYTYLRVIEIVKNNQQKIKQNYNNENLSQSINEEDEINNLDGKEEFKAISNKKNISQNLPTIIESNYESNQYKYVLESYESFPKCPLQLLIFKFVKLSEDKSLLVFRHEFKQPVKQDLIRKIGIEKKKILLDLKNSINYRKYID